MNLDIIRKIRRHEMGDANFQMGDGPILAGLRDVNPSLNKYKINIK